MSDRCVPAPTAVSAGLRYTRTAASLHWLIAAAILVNMLFGFVSALFETTFEPAITNAHKVLGLAVLALSLARLAWRLGHRPPPHHFARPAEKWAATTMHWCLYALSIAMPLTGWVITSSFPGRHPISLGAFDIPFLPIAPNLPRAIAAHDAHMTLGIVMIVLVIGHVLAALRHQLVLRDQLIGRMSING